MPALTSKLKLLVYKIFNFFFSEGAKTRDIGKVSNKIHWTRGIVIIIFQYFLHVDHSQDRWQTCVTVVKSTSSIVLKCTIMFLPV